MTRDSAPPPTATRPIYFYNHRPPLEFEWPNQKRDLDNDESVLITSTSHVMKRGGLKGFGRWDQPLDQ